MTKIPTAKDLAEELIDNGIHSCELKFPKCSGAMFTTLAHRHKRLFYKKRKELLWTFNQVIVACSGCHARLESNREITEEKFMELRGEEII